MTSSQAFTAQIPPAHPREPDPPQVSIENQPSGTQDYGAALTELNIARKNLAIYPATHHQVQSSLDKAQQVLNHLLDAVEMVSIGVADVRLMIGQMVLDPGNPAFAELATVLKQHAVVMLRITAGVTKAELTRFLKNLSHPPNEDAPTAPLADRCKHIHVELMDYSQFRLTRQAHITRPGGGGNGAKGNAGSDIWHDFTSQLLCGSGARPETAALLQSTEGIPPEALARLLNHQQPDADTVSQSYEHIITAQLGQVTEATGDPAESAEVLDNLNRLIHELKPQLQGQFLEAAFQYCSGPDAPQWVEHFLGGLSEDLVVDMIRQANDKGEEISPSLINLVQKIVTTIDDDVLSGLAPLDTADKPAKAQGGSEDASLKALFNREDYETFVIDEYDMVLKGLSDGLGEADEVGTDDFPLAEHQETMEEPHLNHQIARVLLAFMNSTASTDTYSDYATKLMRLVPPLLNQGEFDLVEKIYFAFERHGKQHRRPAKAQIAAHCRQRFSVTPLLEKSITAFQRCSERHPMPPLGYFRMLGPVVVPYAMALLVKAPQDEPIDGLVRMLKLHPGEVQKAVAQHLKKATPKEIGNIVRLMHALEAGHLSKELKPLLDHPEMAVRRQVLEGLASLKEPWGVVFLRDWLKGSREEADAAIEIAGDHQTMELVPDLCARLVRAYLRKSTVKRNIEIINTLGKIGDPYALPILAKVVHSIWPLYPNLRRAMKQAVYQSLTGYPTQSSRPLVSVGLKSKDAQIRRICLELLRSRTN